MIREEKIRIESVFTIGPVYLLDDLVADLEGVLQDEDVKYAR